MVYIVYITTNLVTGQVYLGVHEQEDPYEFDGYLGSGKWLSRAIEKYGAENFTRETLFYYWNEEEAYAKESEIVNEIFIKEEWNYNLTPGGNCPPSHKGTGGVDHHSDETRRKKSIAHIGMKRPDQSKIAIERNFTPPNAKGKRWITDGVNDKYIVGLDIPIGWQAGRSKSKIRRRR